MTLYRILLFASIFVLGIVLRSVIKNKMNIHYSMIWIIWAIGMIIISLFPNIVSWSSSLIGIQVTSNMVFLIFIFFLYCLTFYVYLKLSRHNEDLINLNYELASLKKRIEELEKKKNGK